MSAQNVDSKSFEILLDGMLSKKVSTIDVAKAITLDSALFLDSRKPEEYKVSHIKNAVFIGYEKPNFNVLNSINKNKEIVVYCSIGVRSEKVAEKLVERGFTNVHNLYGGIFEWVNEEKPIVDSDGKTTLNIHPYNKVWGIWLNKGNKVY